MNDHARQQREQARREVADAVGALRRAELLFDNNGGIIDAYEVRPVRRKVEAMKRKLDEKASAELRRKSDRVGA